MNDRFKRTAHMFTHNGKSMAYYEKLETENDALRNQVESLQRQVNALLKRQVMFDGVVELPTRH